MAELNLTSEFIPEPDKNSPEYNQISKLHIIGTKITYEYVIKNFCKPSKILYPWCVINTRSYFDTYLNSYTRYRPFLDITHYNLYDIELTSKDYDIFDKSEKIIKKEIVEISVKHFNIKQIMKTMPADEFLMWINSYNVNNNIVKEILDK